MFGFFKLPTPQEQLIDVQARIDAIEQIMRLTESASSSTLNELKELYYQRNKIKASNPNG